MNTHGICQQARHEPCTYCHAKPGRSCPGGGVHFCRVCLAALDGRITYRDEVSVIPGGVFDGRYLVIDPGAAA
jgi:hypothetical protein